MRKILLPFTILLLVAFDQLSKFLVVRSIALGEIVNVIPNLVSLTYLKNTGAAFSILENQQWFFAIISILVLGAASYYLIKFIQSDSVWLLAGLILIISGGLGNFIDRLRLGYVVDMVHLDFVDFAIFNAADTYLSLGVLLLIIALWREEKNGDSH
ncbi:signal peptidase II [Streptococcus ratti]|uniref:Lipoprotein signal peptidase n=2 Tax=Streptococcus ratti TaxID=1341 RepID=A0A7X9LER6_STRRT|nr:signal peptidase II [Streptococcus ratti]VEI60049.1 lipoprotein signal peptidase [Streptococcus mutans]EJN93735.1 putative lipoprotein signal peptidase [Streptococcus ratti FA-1 = DSM 20564]EMP70652.1 lipoprotein signal peptidase [Streptococcus ratti FA-1 = DSM 20564]NMD49559.1 signal peptidase II [Streptococcus ratti]QEY07591.1 signal peptidase II [Streptococcus ratti]